MFHPYSSRKKHGKTYILMCRKWICRMFMLWHLYLQGAEMPDGMLQRTDSQETPPTPLFDEDVSQPLEEFPRINYQGEGWEMHLRQPNKKKITGQRSICCSWCNAILKTEFWAKFIKPSFVMRIQSVPGGMCQTSGECSLC